MVKFEIKGLKIIKTPWGGDELSDKLGSTIHQQNAYWSIMQKIMIISLQTYINHLQRFDCYAIKTRIKIKTKMYRYKYTIIEFYYFNKIIKLFVDNQMHYMNHNKSTMIVNDKKRIQNDDKIIGQNKQLTKGNRSQEYSHFYKNSYDFYNNGYLYPFMQPAPLCSPYQMPFYHQQYPYHQIPKCISHSQTFQMAGSQSDLIKKEEMAEIVKIQSSQNESRNKIAPLQKKQRKCRKAQARRQQLKIKRKCTKRQQQNPNLQKNLQGYKLPQSIQQQQDLLQLFIQIINIFINQEYSIMTKQKWITCFKSRFQGIQVDPIFNLLTILQFKFEHLKKTKEEFIKYIIRKIYHNLSGDQQKRGKPQYSRLEQFHLKNLVSHGTMNFLFLRKQFSNALFVKLYMEFVKNMDEIMEQDNQKRVERYALFILGCWKQYELYKLYDQRKMPWLKSYSTKTANLCLDLLQKHGSPSDLQTYYKIRGEQQ